jgi:hypothetical protein
VKIAESLPGRSDNAIKNRRNSTLKKRIEEMRTGIARKRRGRPARNSAVPKSADDIPKPPKFEDLRQTFASPPHTAVPNWLSPFALCSPKSPFSLFSPQMKDQMFGLDTPLLDQSDRGFSPMLFGESDNRASK